jgi:hypothetical protein
VRIESKHLITLIFVGGLLFIAALLLDTWLKFKDVPRHKAPPWDTLSPRPGFNRMAPPGHPLFGRDSLRNEIVKKWVDSVENATKVNQ